ncbi:MAG: hypothetical protein B6244_13590 [Candidatus Cloacimonetes bacterium 4572_55]|nr:MAG: hypothetical protein B6244_13590 [Candidatus Cloacimonetes bacterium 4572_55]
MVRKYLNFIRGISVNWYGKLGVIIATSSFLTFILFEFARLTGLLTNQYMGMIMYMALPGLFILGLGLIPIGWFSYKRAMGKSSGELLSARFPSRDIQAKQTGSNVFLIAMVLSLANVIFISAVGFRTLHFMDSSEFCGTACHEVMGPEWTVYQNSPHARVKCVECHVGQGLGALMSSKFEGARQLISSTFDLYQRPIPTPVHQLRPARETCEKCHWPSKFYGKRLKTIIHYAEDEESTPSYTTLALKVDSGTSNNRGGIHWHIGKENYVRFASVDDNRKDMIWVEVKQPDGSYKRFTNENFKDENVNPKAVRSLDCADCHNRATHIYENPDDALDFRMQDELIDRTLPYIRREGLKAITKEYASQDEALSGITNSILQFYQEEYPEIAQSKKEEIETAIHVLQEIYSRNIHHEMNITWGVYRNLLGHEDDEDGCARCHNEYLVDEDEETISEDCDLCHFLLTYEDEEPFEYFEE